MQGKIDNFVPTVEFELCGYDKQFSKKLTGIVDTGFNGFLKVPYVDAFPAALILQGTETSTIANGSQTTDLACIGSVTMFPCLWGIGTLLDYFATAVLHCIYDDLYTVEIKAGVPCKAP